MRYFLFRLHWIARLSDLQRGSFSGRSLKLCPTENWIICFIVKIVKRPVIKYTYKRVISILFPFQYADLGQLESWNWNFFKGMLDPERSLRSYGPGCYLGNPMWRHLWSFHSRSADIFIHCFFSCIVDREVAMRSNQRLFMHLLSKPPRPRCIITEIKSVLSHRSYTYTQRTHTRIRIRSMYVDLRIKYFLRVLDALSAQKTFCHHFDVRALRHYCRNHCAMWRTNANWRPY